MPCGKMQYNAALRQNMLGICRKINLIHIKKEFFANYISVYKNYGMRNT